MALYTRGDLHLSLGSEKPMDIFGDKWKNHAEKLKKNFEIVGPDDITVLCGDHSWGMSLQESLKDLQFINALPGKKLLLKGNHDYWWGTANKIKTFFEANGIDSLELLHNNAFSYGDYAICGTRGWFYEEEKGGDHDKKIMNREIMRLEASLKAAGDREKLVFLHYPPIYQHYKCQEILDLLKKYGVRMCCYGHIHGKGTAFSFNGWREGTEFKLVSADFVDFKPVKLRF